MKQTFTLLLCAALCSISVFAQKTLKYDSPNTPIDNIGHWEDMAQRGVVQRNPSYPVKPATPGSSMVLTPKGLQNSPDVLVLDETGNTQSENSIFVDPNNRDYALNSNNSNDGGTVYGANYLTSPDGGLVWTGSKLGAGGTDKGDPAACIGLNGRHYIGAINSSRKQVVSWSDDGTTWNKVNVVSGSLVYPNLLDKNHLWVDNTNSPYEGYIYDAWVNLVSGDANETDIEFSRSTNDGISWSTPINISNAIAAGSHNQGVNIQCNNTGWVFAVWAVYDDWGAGVYNEDAIGFARSGNGGSTFYSASRIVNNIKGIRESASVANSTGKNMRVNSFPSMAIDVSGGPNHGHIYVVWANIGVPGTNTGTNVSVYMTTSTNGGTIWSTPTRINTVAASNHAAFMPWITCDPVTGNLYTIFYDDRNLAVGGSDLETWVAFSDNGGASWSDMAVSDVSFTPAPIPGLATGYFGDYLGISAYNGKVYPAWTDNRSGRALTYVSPLDFGCTASASNTSFEYISNVNFGSISNPSASTGYTDYTALSNNLPLNAIEPITVTNGQGYGGDQCGIWVDWNRDDDFDDANETITVTGSGGAGPYTASIGVPAGTTLGQCLMRVRITYTGALEPCGISTYGEVEDYTINVTAAATSNSWIGVTSSDWNTGSNWLLGTVPSTTVSASIPAGTPYSPIISSGYAYCNGLYLSTGATLAQNTGTYFYCYGTFDAGFGQFTMSGTSYLYFAGTTNTVWWDDNQNDTYTNVRVEKSISTASMNMQNNMTCSGTFEVREGVFSMNNSQTLTVTSVAASAFEVEPGGSLILNDPSKTITVTGNVHFMDGSQATLTNGTINCAGNFVVDANTLYNIGFTDGTLVMNGSSTQYISDLDGGNLDLKNLTIAKSAGVCYIQSANLDVNGNLMISGGALSCDNGPSPTATYNINIAGNWTNNVGTSGFAESTGRVIFDGPGHQYVYSNETFNILEANMGAALRPGSYTVVCNVYDWTTGGVDVNTGTFTALDLADNGISGGFWVNTGGTINLTNSGTGTYVDLNGDIHIYGGTMNVTGSISDWPYTNNALIEMSGGVLDFTSCGITIASSGYTLTQNITGGIIRTAGGFSGNRADFTPTAGTFEFYGSSDVFISQTNNCTLYNVDINKGAKGQNSNPLNPAVLNGRIDKTIGNAKVNSIAPISNFNITNDLTITSGLLTLNGHNLSVGHNSSVYGTLTMNNALDVFNSGTNYWDQMRFYSGSTGNISNGNVNINGWIVPDAGCSFTATVNNTINFIGVTGGGPSNFEPLATYGNLVFNKNANQRAYIDNAATYPIVVNGNVSIFANNEFEMQDETLIVHGLLTDVSSSKVYAYNAAKNESLGDFVCGTKASDPDNLETTETNTGTLTKDGAKGGYLEIDNAFTLNGLLDVGDGSVLHHGYFNIASTGTLTIGIGSYVCDYILASGWSYLSGVVNMTDGLLELTNSSVSFNGTANISGGIFRLGRSFTANAVSAGFQPTGGTLELIGSTTGNYISVYNGNFVYNFLFNKTSSYMIYPASTNDLIIKGNVEINSGIFNTNGNDIFVGGNWANNSGSAAFTESTATVIFNGANSADILTNETFYDLTINKTYAGFDGVEINGIVNLSNNLNIISSAIEMNNNSALNVTKNVDIALNAGLNAWGDIGLSISVGGNWTNNNTTWNTNYGYSPGSEVITFNGTTDQIITTNADREDFGNLVINKATGEFRSNDSINVMHDFTLTLGKWHDNANNLTHYFQGNFFITSGSSALWNSLTHNTVVFKGTSDQTVYNPFGAGYFYNVIVDKTGFAKSKEAVDPISEIGQKSVKTDNLVESETGNSKDPKAMMVNLTSALDIEGSGGGLTIKEGILNLNGNTFWTMGNININNGGVLIVDDNAVLKVNNGNQLNVNNGGVLQAIGSTGNNARITNRGTGNYNFNVNPGGTLAAEYATLEYIGWYGVYVLSGATVDPAHAFNYCTFQNVQATVSASDITLDNSQSLISTGAHFPDNPYYNIYKTNGLGDITFNSATGDFAGAEYEYDPAGDVFWGDVDVDMNLTAMLAGPFNGSTMNTNLKASGLIPLNQPFNSNPSADWYYTGTESVASIPPNTVDWVLVQIRDAIDVFAAGSGTVVAEQAAFLLNDGSIVNLDGSSNLQFPGISYSSGLFPVVWHRNHLGIIASNKMTRSSGIYTYDFTQPGAALGGTNGQKEIGAGIWGMYGGDANGTGLVALGDLTNFWSLTSGETGYKVADFNLDGQVDNKDKNDVWLIGLLKNSQITGSKGSE